MGLLFIFGIIIAAVVVVVGAIIILYELFLLTEKKPIPPNTPQIWNLASNKSGLRDDGVQISVRRGTSEYSWNRIRIGYYPLNTSDPNPKMAFINTRIDNIIDIPQGILSKDHPTRIILPSNHEELYDKLGILKEAFGKNIIMSKLKNDVAIKGYKEMDRAMREEIDVRGMNKMEKIKKLLENINDIVANQQEPGPEQNIK